MLSTLGARVLEKRSVGTDSGTTRFGHSVGPAHRRWNGGTNGKQIPTVRVLCWDNFVLNFTFA